MKKRTLEIVCISAFLGLSVDAADSAAAKEPHRVNPRAEVRSKHNQERGVKEALEKQRERETRAHVDQMKAKEAEIQRARDAARGAAAQKAASPALVARAAGK